MGSNNKLKGNYFKNRTFYYFDYIIKIEDFDFYYILIDEKSCENILVYNISYKSSIGAKPLHISFNKVDRFIRVFDGTRYLILFGPEIYDAIINSIRYLIGVKSSITYVIAYVVLPMELMSGTWNHFAITTP